MNRLCYESKRIGNPSFSKIATMLYSLGSVVELTSMTGKNANYRVCPVVTQGFKTSWYFLERTQVSPIFPYLAATFLLP